jgi:hypothetical protein
VTRLVVVWKLDHLGRNIPNLLALIDDLGSRAVHFRSVTEGIRNNGTDGPTGFRVRVPGDARHKTPSLSAKARKRRGFPVGSGVGVPSAYLPPIFRTSLFSHWVQSDQLLPVLTRKETR